MVTKTRFGIMSGNLIEVRLNDALIGVIQNINANEDLGLQAATGIGRPRPYEHVVGQVRYSLSVDVLQVLPQALIKNIDLEGMGILNFEDAEIAPKVAEDLLKGVVFDIVVKMHPDHGGKQLYRWEDCSYGGGSIQVAKHVITSRNANFLAIDKIYGDGVPA